MLVVIIAVVVIVVLMIVKSWLLRKLNLDPLGWVVQVVLGYLGVEGTADVVSRVKNTPIVGEIVRDVIPDVPVLDEEV